MLVLAMLMLGTVGGIAGAIQAPVNAGLGRHVGPLQATWVSTLGSFLIMLCANVAVFVATGQTGLVNLGTCQWWMLLGGLEGSFILFGVATCTHRLGVALTVTLSMLGQMTACTVVDAFGLMETPAVPTNPLRIAGIALFVVGIVLVYKGRLEQARQSGEAESQDKPLRFMILMFVCGAVAGIQMPTNVALQSHVGIVEALGFHFFIGSTTMLMLVLLTQKGKINSFKGVAPWKMSGGVYGAIGVPILIIVTPVLGTALNSAVMTLGQLSGAVVIDSFGLLQTKKVHVNVWRIAGVVALLFSIVLVTVAKL